MSSLKDMGHVDYDETTHKGVIRMEDTGEEALNFVYDEKKSVATFTPINTAADTDEETIKAQLLQHIAVLAGRAPAGTVNPATNPGATNTSSAGKGVA